MSLGIPITILLVIIAVITAVIYVNKAENDLKEEEQKPQVARQYNENVDDICCLFFEDEDYRYTEISTAGGIEDQLGVSRVCAAIDGRVEYVGPIRSFKCGESI